MKISLACALLLLSACGGSAATAPGTDAAATSDDIDYTAESTDTATHGTAPDVLSAGQSVSSLFVQQDPTLNVSMTAAQNADAVAAQLTSSVMVSTCAMASIVHTTGTVGVSVDFGTGCTLPNVGTISGSGSATVAKVAGSITVALTLTNIVVDGETINGSVSLSTSDATTFTFTMNVMTSTDQVMFKGTATLDADGKGVTLAGSGSSAKSGVTLDFTMTGVHHEFSACYADAGTMTVTKPTKTKHDISTTLTETITFTSTTPATGTITVTISGVSTPTTLPAMGSCPHS